MRHLKLNKAEGNLMGYEVPSPSAGDHYCRLTAQTDYGMYEQSPRAGIWKKIQRLARKLCIPSYIHPLCNFYYPSKASIFKAWVAISKTRYPQLIHPFSRVALIWEAVMIITWSFLFLYRPFTIASVMITDNIATYHPITELCMSAILFLNIAKNFVTGYPTTLHVVLNFRSIARHYITTYFVIDLIDALPIAELYYLTGGRNIFTYSYLCCLHMLQFLRLKTYFEYSAHLIHFFSKKETIFIGRTRLLYVLLSAWVMMHWNSCLVFLLLRARQAPTNFYEQKSADPRRERIELVHTIDYLIVLDTVVCNFMNVMSNIRLDQPMYVLVPLLVGFVFRVFLYSQYIKTKVFHIKPAIKCEGFLREVNEYMATEELSLNIKQRVALSFRYTFKGTFVPAEKIEHSLSDHLLHELNLVKCAHMMEVARFSRNLSRKVIGEIITDLEPTFFLAGDVVVKYNDEAGDIYIISYGRTAIYNDSGMEVLHIDDGSLIGIGAFFFGRHKWTIVAIETTEAYIWKKKDIRSLYKRSPSAQIALEEELHARVREYTTILRDKKVADKVEKGGKRTKASEKIQKLLKSSIFVESFKKKDAGIDLALTRSRASLTKFRVVQQFAFSNIGNMTEQAGLTDNEEPTTVHIDKNERNFSEDF